VVVGGVSALLLAGGFFSYLFWGLRETTIRNGLGHLQIYNAQFFQRDETRALENGLDNYRELAAVATNTPHVRGIAPRIEFFGMVSNGMKMPGLNGFELLARLPQQPVVIFTTAFDQYALKAFEVNSIDYLLKPVDRRQLERAIAKLERLRAESARQPDLRAVIEQLAASLRADEPHFPDRIASRAGERVQLLELAAVTHFFARDKLTFAASGGRTYSVDYTIADLEQKLDPRRFLRIHRAVLLNLDWVREVDSWFAGRVRVRLKDEPRTELTVARDRVRALKERLGF
jgi:two-component system LytT family response regulator